MNRKGGSIRFRAKSATPLDITGELMKAVEEITRVNRKTLRYLASR